MRKLAWPLVVAFAVLTGAQQATQPAGQPAAAQASQGTPPQTSQAPSSPTPATQAGHAGPTQSQATTNPTPAAQPGQAAAMQSGQQRPASTSASQKVIKDPAEYDAYITAFNVQDPAARAAAMDAFVKQYPQSIVLPDALEQAMGAYQQAQNGPKLEETAKRILQREPNHTSALAVVVALDRNKINNEDKQALQALKEICPYAQTGLQQLPAWHKPESVSGADYQKAQDQMTEIFNGAAGFCALQQKDYVTARGYFLKSLGIDPNNFVDNYQLAIAYLETDPIDLAGFWYGAKALRLAKDDARALNAISPYFKRKFKKYHAGKPEEWDQFVGTAASQAAPPSAAELAKLIPPAPTPCELAVDVLKDNKPEDLPFSDKEFILSKVNCSAANKAAADKVWQSIQDTEKGGRAKLQFSVKVIAASRNTVDVAIMSDDDPAADKADVHVELQRPLLKQPAPGTLTKVIGVITKYTPDPFMFTMEQGEMPGMSPAAPSKRTRAAAQKPAG